MSQKPKRPQSMMQVAAKFAYPAYLAGLTVLGGDVMPDAMSELYKAFKAEDLLDAVPPATAVVQCVALAGCTKFLVQNSYDKELGILGKYWNPTITTEKFVVAAERRENLLIQQRLLHGGAVVAVGVGLTAAPAALGVAAVCGAVATVAGFREHSLKKELREAAKIIVNGPTVYNPVLITALQRHSPKYRL